MNIFYFAELNEDNTVMNIVGGETSANFDTELNSLKVISGHDRWIETKKDDQNSRFASVGGSYNQETNSFIDKKPDAYPSWVLNAVGYWEPPTPSPDRYTEENWPVEYGEYTNTYEFYWNEELLSWKVFIFRPENNDV